MYVNFLLTGFCSRMTYVWCLRYLIFKLGIVWFSFFFQMLMKPKLNAAAKTDKQYANSYLYVLCELNASGKIYKQYAHILQLNTTTGCL